MISSISVPICNVFYATRNNCGKITLFRRVAVFDARLRLPPAISSQFSVEMCAASKYCEKFTKLLLWGRGSRSFKVIYVDKFKKLVTSACYDKQHVRTYLQPFSHYTCQ